MEPGLRVRSMTSTCPDTPLIGSAQSCSKTSVLCHSTSQSQADGEFEQATQALSFRVRPCIGSSPKRCENPEVKFKQDAGCVWKGGARQYPNCAAPDSLCVDMEHCNTSPPATRCTAKPAACRSAGMPLAPSMSMKWRAPRAKRTVLSVCMDIARWMPSTIAEFLSATTRCSNHGSEWKVCCIEESDAKSPHLMTSDNVPLDCASFCMSVGLL
mmetsp:Transcript_110211/g.310857  ORF Transcript_110211/g.310857 Transcript_110211/m.310857 type:complete len:213 (+) Transcript_110211:999-1637(+)